MMYTVYEITRECRENGIKLKDFSKQKDAVAFMNESIYRYVKENHQIISVTL